jgi:apolipoprotein N-acyltransferase
MAKSAPNRTVADPVAKPPRQRSMIWLQGLACGAVATLAPPTALLMGVLLGPALLALLVDRQPGRPKARSVALFGMAASVEALRSLWVGGHTISAAVALMGDLQVVATAWVAAAGGWLLAEAAPIAVRATLDLLSSSRAARLRGLRAHLASEWGLDPTGDQ